MTPTIATLGNVVELGDLTLYCQFGGFRISSLTWLRRIGQEVQTINFLIKSNRSSVVSAVDYTSCPPTLNSTLKIFDVTPEDNGEYICTTTSLGISESVQLLVTVPGTSQL